jgi:hypothetical protein
MRRRVSGQEKSIQRPLVCVSVIRRVAEDRKHGDDEPKANNAQPAVQNGIGAA